jgi:hypothetical protein
MRHLSRRTCPGDDQQHKSRNIPLHGQLQVPNPRIKPIRVFPTLHKPVTSISTAPTQLPIRPTQRILRHLRPTLYNPRRSIYLGPTSEPVLAITGLGIHPRPPQQARLACQNCRLQRHSTRDPIPLMELDGVGNHTEHALFQLPQEQVLGRQLRLAPARARHGQMASRRQRIPSRCRFLDRG